MSFNGPSSTSFIVYFRPFQTNITFFYRNIKIVHPVSGAGIQALDFLNASLLLLDQGPHSKYCSEVYNFAELNFVDLCGQGVRFLL